MITTHLVMFSFFDGASESGAVAFPVGSLALMGVGI